MSQIRHESPLPLYHQIANILRSRMDLLEWAPGEQLPSESALASAFGVSAMTVRQALSLLVQEGCLRRRQGLGTFVTEQRRAADRVRLTASLNEITAGVAGLKVKVLDIERVRGPKQIMEVLRLPAGESAVQIRRLRLSGSRPMSYAIAYMPSWLGGQLTPEELRTPLLIDLLESKGGVFFREAYQTIEASIADVESSTLLEVPAGSPLLLVQRTYELETGGIGYVAINRYPSHLFRYEIRLVRGQPHRGSWQVST